MAEATNPQLADGNKDNKPIKKRTFKKKSDKVVPISPDSKIHWVETLSECSICLELFNQPIQLPCSHIFCYLCAKGFIQHDQHCALCRKDVGMETILSPVLVKVKEREGSSDETPKKKAIKRKCNKNDDTGDYDDDGDASDFLWFYQGRNGWWQYDERTSVTLEEAFKNKSTSCEIMIVGYLYIIDFEKMKQFRKDNPTCKRSIKRDMEVDLLKGVAGLKHKKLK